jgi:hypothetical protein
MNTPKFGYAKNSAQGGDDPVLLHTLDDYLKAQVLLEMDSAGIPANQSYNEDEFSALIQRLKDGLKSFDPELLKRLKDDSKGTVDAKDKNALDTYIKNYCEKYNLDN